jgi:hypothetical protein
MSLSVKTFSPSDLRSPTVDRVKVMVVCAPGSALVGRPTLGQAKEAGPALLCQPGHERTVALGHALISAQWTIWGKEIPFLFPRIVKSVSKHPKFVSNSFLVQKL